MTKWLSLVLIVFLTSCGLNNNQVQENTNENVVHVKNSAIQEVDRTSGQQISKRLVQLASSIPNVNDATAVVLGKYAIVGIDVNANLERSEVGSIKYSVAESLKNDPYGARAIIIADPDLNARLREISEDIQNGKPIQGIMNELADISGRLMPEIPADIIEPTPKNATEEPKKKLNNKDEQKLEKQQDTQSNYYKDKHE
ncbi:YhcN/YlaJ family sporulation lipoprotein [Cytobacillus dafuensis]|uniref:YhcN/YlaJ family sporulation lipoprotein n=1 Tax=Cytobacillus dafuensis TaxID=1742359 RepID=A0A5B8Z7Q4_CYTDA|nr:YhcN/YlaJ family sporulation lipoprotein [Cytobacillus dafuensis]QED47396.1 YhcN/YlaJ family sporulation lipoprotein [Cytobacillus dafuensis]